MRPAGADARTPDRAATPRVLSRLSRRTGPRDLADQYLEFGRDARKRQDFATARLLAIRPTALATPATPAAAAPSLEEFAAEHDPDGFHTEKELFDLFTVDHDQSAAGRGDAAPAAAQCAPEGQADVGARRSGPPR